MGDKDGITTCLEGFARVAAGRGYAIEAAHLYAAADKLRREIGNSLMAGEQADYDRAVATVRAQLDAATFEAAWAAGRAMTIETAIGYALESLAK
jgi:hypothetical protein